MLFQDTQMPSHLLQKSIGTLTKCVCSMAGRKPAILIWWTSETVYQETSQNLIKQFKATKKKLNRTKLIAEPAATILVLISKGSGTLIEDLL